MVKYNHCEKCKKIYNTEVWIGEVHIYDGFCSSCMPGEKEENQMKQESAKDHIVSDKAVNCYKIYSGMKEPFEITKKMVLHPFNEIQKKLRTLPFYD